MYSPLRWLLKPNSLVLNEDIFDRAPYSNQVEILTYLMYSEIQIVDILFHIKLYTFQKTCQNLPSNSIIIDGYFERTALGGTAIQSTC